MAADVGALWRPGQADECINHIFFVVDESWSMKRHQDAMVTMMDNTVAHLADRSKFHDQETRITFYTFSERGGERCLFYDKDVLRMPSIAGLYSPRGQTALIDCALLAISDMQKAAQLYGLHANLGYLFTDGIENNSRARPPELAMKIAGLPQNWTLAAFVPDQQGVFDLKKCGVPAGNIAVWDTTSSVGIDRVGSIVRDASESFMEGRSRGVHGYSGTGSAGLFTVRDFSAEDVMAAAVPLTPGSYELFDVPVDQDISPFVALVTRRPYQPGKACYQLTARKTVLVQDYKGIFVETGGRIYAGDGIRSVLGLPNGEAVKLKGDQKQDCTIFIQSNSYNRKLLAGTRLLVLR